MQILTPLPIQPPINRTKHNLQYPLPGQRLPAPSQKRHRINHIPDLPARNLTQLIIQRAQMRFRILITTHLEKLDSDLPGWRV